MSLELERTRLTNALKKGMELIDKYSPNSPPDLYDARVDIIVLTARVLVIEQYLLGVGTVTQDELEASLNRKLKQQVNLLEKALIERTNIQDLKLFER